MSKIYTVGKDYREWLTKNQFSNNEAKRYVLMDFTAGTNISLALLTDIVMSNKLAINSARFRGEERIVEFHEIINDLKLTYNNNSIGEAKLFLEGFAGLNEGSLSIGENNANPQDINQEIEEVENHLPEKQQKLTSGRKLYKQSIILTLKTLAYRETYIWLFLFIYLELAIGGESIISNSDGLANYLALTTAIWIFAGPMFFYIFENISSKKKYLVKLKLNRDYWQSTWNYFKCSFISSLYIFVGFILLVIPGLIFGINYLLVGPISVLEKRRPDDTLKRSKDMTNKVRGSIIKALLLICLSFFVIGLIEGLIPESLPKMYLIVFIDSLSGIWFAALFFAAYESVRNSEKRNFT